MEKQEKNNGLALTSMILGIVGILFSFCLGFGILLSIPALILGIMAVVKKQGGMGVAGIILGSVGLILSPIIGFIGISTLLSLQEYSLTTI